MSEILFARSALKDIKKLTPQTRERIRSKLNFFASQQYPLNFATYLTQPADAQYRFRIGDYRVLFDVDGDNIVVLRVEHRREVYKR